MTAAHDEDVDFEAAFGSADDDDASFEDGNGIESFNGDEVLNIKDPMNPAANAQLKTIVERIERLEEDEDAVKMDKKEVYLEAKGNGFDVKTLRALIRRRKQDKAKRLEEESLLDLYEAALEMIA